MPRVDCDAPFFKIEDTLDTETHIHIHTQNYMHQILNFSADLIHELYEVYRQTMADPDVINQARYFRRLAMEITFQNNLLAAGYEEEDDRRYGPGF